MLRSIIVRIYIVKVYFLSSIYLKVYYWVVFKYSAAFRRTGKEPNGQPSVDKHVGCSQLLIANLIMSIL